MKQSTHTAAPRGLDLVQIRSRLEEADPPRYWRGLDQLAETDEFLDYLHREFPEQAADWADRPTRRRFLELTAASMALAGFSGCSYQPQEKIVPYVKSPEEIVQGKPLYFATSRSQGGYAIGLLVENHQGRPTKAEGNEAHPASLGAIDSFSTASVLDLYDVDRSQAVLHNGRPSTWDDFQQTMLDEYQKRKGQAGASKFRIVTAATSSPSLIAQIQGLLGEIPGSKWYQYEPVSRDAVRAGTSIAFGKPLEPRYKLQNAQVIVSLDADFLSATEPGHLALVRAFADLRDPDREAGGSLGEMNRLYCVESGVSVTGAKADHRLALAPSQILPFTQALAREAGVPGVEGNAPEGEAAKWVAAVAKDLKAHNGKSLVVAGCTQPPIVHALAAALNSTLGNVGQTVEYIEPVVPADTGVAGLRELVRDIQNDAVDFLVLLGVNPVYDAPVDLEFRDALLEVPLRVHAGHYDDETGTLCHWHLPLAHYLEAWGDSRAFDGTATLQQPLIRPLYEGRSELEIVGMLRGQRDPDGREMVETHWKTQPPFQDQPDAFQAKWRAALHDGLIADTASPAAEATLQPASGWPKAAPEATTGVEIRFIPDPTIHDGRFANNAWLQEIPKPISKIVWDNPLLISPKQASELGVTNGDLVTITYDGRELEAAAWIDPGHAYGSVTLTLGYGRPRAGRIGNGTGFNAYALRTADHPWGSPGAQIARAGGTYQIATTQSHNSLEGRNHLREATLETYRANPDFAPQMEALGEHQPQSIYPPFDYSQGYKWGMSIDLSRCLGCTACITACQAENNIAIVGKDQVSRKRSLHWLEVDRYYSGEGSAALDAPRISSQPRMCMQCETAPCEVVCPVAATVHDAEGLNNMVYNRCVGTRYCSNNCPYKVRKFNFLRFSQHLFQKLSPTGEVADSPLALVMNPDVTIRPRGVMEKCTYCVQRISEKKIQAQLEDRKVRDGEVVTACQQACAARAIHFGDLNDETSQVVAMKKRPRNYGMLAELNTAPRTTYLAGLRNPNPELEAV